MQCPKCKKEILDNSLKCEFCGTKIGSICPDCGNINPLTAMTCKNCGKILLQLCPKCGAANRPEALVCRKCEQSLKIEDQTPAAEKQEKNEETNELPKYQTNGTSQQKVKQDLVSGIKDANIRVISLAGESGIGKSLTLQAAYNELKDAKLIWLKGTCTQTSQLSPFGYIQDLLLTFFNINNFCTDTLNFKKNSIKFFKQDFPMLNTNEILDLLNMLYPENVDKYENIYYNKAKMFTIAKKLFLTIIEKMKTIFIVDGFEQMDGMSYDFLKELFQDELVQERAKIIFICKDFRPAMGILYINGFDSENYLDLAIAKFTKEQEIILTKELLNGIADKNLLPIIQKIANGNPAVIEQTILLKKELIEFPSSITNINSFEDIISLRLNTLKTVSYTEFRMLTAMSVLGVKIRPAILEQFDKHPPDEFEQILKNLVSKGYIIQSDTLSFEFKSKKLWEAIVSIVKNDSSFEEILNVLYENISIYKQSSIAMLGYIIQKLCNHDLAFDTWTLLMKYASYIGDIGLYIISQKQALKLIENKSGDFYLHVKKNIYTRVGKLLEPIDHNLSFEYLQNAIMMIDDDEIANQIELLGYIASCSMKSGNYCGIIECIDNVLNKISDNKEIEKNLIKSRKTTPLLKLGNYGQLIILIETEILPALEKFLSRGKNSSVAKLSDIFETWINVYIDFAEALVFQGDNRCFDIIQNIYDVIEKNKIDSSLISCKTNLLLALANTIKGDINTSEKILTDILKDYSLDNMNSFIVSRWNFIDILNKFFRKDYNSLQSELFNVVAYANNSNDNFTKNILKTLFAKILKDNNQTKKALEILEEQVAYFAKEKVATGVLLSWYLIAEIKLITNGSQFALDIASKALDIAQSPNINNYYFIALFNKLIGEIYMAKQDFESAKVYFEKSIFISKQFDLQFILVKAYLQCTRLYQELALPKSNMRKDYIKQALKMFQLAKNVPIVNEHTSIQKIIKEDLNILLSFCRLNGIILKKNDR